MLLINNLTIDEINAALIALYKAGATVKEVVKVQEGSKVDTEEVNSLKADINSIRNSVAANTQTNDYQNRQINELLFTMQSLVSAGIDNIAFDEQTRTLTLTTTNNMVFSCNIPSENISMALDPVTNVLTLIYGTISVSLILPYINVGEKGIANGVATLDATGRVPYEQMPESAMSLLGEWYASTNTPHLADGTGNMGDFYIVMDDGTVDFGHGSQDFYTNDRVIYLNGLWKRLPAGSVISVNGKTGVVELTAADINYDTHNTVGDKIGQIDNHIVELEGKTISYMYFNTPERKLYLFCTDGSSVEAEIPEGVVVSEDYIIDPADERHRLKVSANGITSQYNENEDPSGPALWVDKGVVLIDKYGNIILNNSNEKVKYGFTVEGDIYHFDNQTHPEYDEEGENPQNITTEGEVVSTADTDPIISFGSSPFCFNGTVIKSLSDFFSKVVVLSKAEGIVVGDKILYTDGTSEDYKDLSSYNETMRETSSIDPTKTVGAYLGLNEDQVENGIFN